MCAAYRDYVSSVAVVSRIAEFQTVDRLALDRYRSLMDGPEKNAAPVEIYVHGVSPRVAVYHHAPGVQVKPKLAEPETHPVEGGER